MKGFRKGRSAAGGAVLAGLILVGIGGTVGFLLRPSGAPPALPEASPPTAAPVGVAEFSDEHKVQVSLRSSPAPPLLLETGGRVTANPCQAGRKLESGQVAARIDGTTVIALATPTPLYRDLRRGSAGKDVEAVQRELGRLGYAVLVDGRFGEQTKAAVQEFQESLGMSHPDGVIHYERFLWLPDHTVTPDSCELVRGEYVAPHRPYAKISDQLTAVVAESIPQDAVDGARTMTVLGVTGPMNNKGVAENPEFIRKVSSTREYQQLRNSPEKPALTATIALQEPLDTVKVPPGALFAVEGKHACVQSGNTTLPVRIVGSKLGVSLVLLQGEAPEKVNLGSAITEDSCGNNEQ